MFTRAEILKQFGLPDRATFGMEPERDPHGIWRIKVSYEGGAAIHMAQGHAARLADVIRSVDQRLAKQVDACIARARRHSQNSN